MAKLSRTNKYQQLRDQLDEETTAAQAVSSSQIKLTRNENANPVSHAKSSDNSFGVLFEEKQTGVIDELVGEVKQYNINNGERTAEDTQMNIFKTLDEDTDQSQKRRAHLEEMESNSEDQGGTTMNMNAISIEKVSKPSFFKSSAKSAGRKPETENEEHAGQEQAGKAAADEAVQEEKKPELVEITYEESLKIGREGLLAEDKVDDDKLELFDLGVDDYDQNARTQKLPVQTPKKKKKVKENREEDAKPVRKKAKPAAAILSSDQDEEDGEKKEESSGSKMGNIIMIILILILLGAIGYTIYLISRIGIL